MKKQNLLHYLTDELIEKLYGFCYPRTNDSNEAKELCSDIIYALVKAGNSDGEMEDVYAFIWKIARNVYADFSKRRKAFSDNMNDRDDDDLLSRIADETDDDDSAEKLQSVYRRIACLTGIYRDVMISFYLDGCSTAEIAKKQNVKEATVRQRLFCARGKIKNEVKSMTKASTKPVYLDKIDMVIWGNGNPYLNDPRTVCKRQFSYHIVYLCMQKPRTAAEIAEILQVPTLYVEEELEILRKGENGKYGFLRKLDNGKYGINIILLDRETKEKLQNVYKSYIPEICDITADFIEAHKEEYLAYPYLNKKPTMNLILWSNLREMSYIFTRKVWENLKDYTLFDIKQDKPDRPFTVFGYIHKEGDPYYGVACDDTSAQNICGISFVTVKNYHFANRSIMKPHFYSKHDIGNDSALQMVLRCIDGISVSSLSDSEKEHAAKAMENGYIYKEGDMLYTKVLVMDEKYNADEFDTTNKLKDGYFDTQAKKAAEKIGKILKDKIPEYLLSEVHYANAIASDPVVNFMAEYFMKKGLLQAPENQRNAEGVVAYIKR